MTQGLRVAEPDAAEPAGAGEDADEAPPREAPARPPEVLAAFPLLARLCALAVVGLMLFVFSPWIGLAFVGALLWGAGASLGFPVGMSAAADEPAAAATRVSVVASIGYVAFLGGPPLIGFLGEHVGVHKALTVVAILLGVAALLAGALRPPMPADEAPTQH